MTNTTMEQFSLTREDVLVRGHGDEAIAALADRLQSILNVARDAVGTARRNPGFNETGKRDAIGKIGRMTLEELDKANAATRSEDLDAAIRVARRQLLAVIWKMPEGVSEEDLPEFKRAIRSKFETLDPLERDMAVSTAVAEEDTLTLQSLSRLPPALRLVDEDDLKAARERLARAINPETAAKVEAMEARRFANAGNVLSARQAVEKMTGARPDVEPVVTAITAA